MKLRPPVGLRLGALACCLAAELVTSGPALSQGAATAPTPAAATVTQTTPDGKTVKTVIADGLGSTVESAVQNAAENALKQVVGSLIDTEKQVERRSQIADGTTVEAHELNDGPPNVSAKK